MKSAFGVEHISKSKKRDAALVAGGAAVPTAAGGAFVAHRLNRIRQANKYESDLWSMPAPPPSSTPSNVGPPPPPPPGKKHWRTPGVRQRGIPGDKFPKAKLDDIFSAAKQAGKLK